MTAAGPWLQRRFRRRAWLLGCLVLTAALAALGYLLLRGRPSAALDPARAAVVLAATGEPAPRGGQVAAATGPLAAPAAVGADRVLGTVRLPDGRPCPGATVVLYRARTAWPEWSSEVLDQAITGLDGGFQFAVAGRRDLLVGFAHPRWAGGLEEVPTADLPLELSLQPGFALGGLVLSDRGQPLANALVVVEPVVADQRRAQSVGTGSDGRYEFRNLPAGPVRLVARHPAFQPVVAPAVVVGAVSRYDLTMARSAPAELRGRVLSASGQQPLAGALLQLVPPNGKLGLVAPVSATTSLDGSFLLSGLAPGTALLHVQHPEHGALQRSLAIRASGGELVLELPSRSALAGRLLASAGVATAGLWLRLRDSGGELAATAVDDSGRFEFASRFSPGPALLWLEGGRHAFERSRSAELSVRIEERAQNTLELPILASARLQLRLQDEAGQPLPGVRVLQTRQLAENARWLGDAAVSLDVGAFGSQVAQIVASDRDALLGQSDAAGRVEFGGLKPGPLLLRCELAGRGSRWLRIQVPEPGGMADLGAVSLPPAGRLRGRVLRGGAPLAGASVTATGKEGQATAVTAGDGSFVIGDLAPDAYRVRARLPSMPTANAELQLELPAGRAELQVPPLVLPPGRMLRGSVQGSDGQPVPAAMVTVRGAAGQPTLTDANGRFALELPPRANIELQVALVDRSYRRIVTVDRSQDEIEVQLDTPPSCTLVGQVFGLPGRKRPPAALLRLQPLTGGEAAARTRWIELRSGELRWPLAPVGRVRVTLQCEGYAPWSVERDFLANEEHALGEILLEPGCSLRGQVVTFTGAPVADAAVLLGDEADLDLFEPTVRTAADGSFVISGVSTRASRITIRAPGLAPLSRVLRLPEDVLSDAPLQFALVAGVSIQVLASPSRRREGGLLQLLQEGRVLATAEFDEQGRAEFRHRATGRYELQLYGSELPPRSIEIDGRAELVTVRW